MLRATTACTFSTLQRTKVVRTRWSLTQCFFLTPRAKNTVNYGSGLDTTRNPKGRWQARPACIRLRRLPTSGLPYERPRAHPCHRPSNHVPRKIEQKKFTLDRIRVTCGRLEEHFLRLTVPKIGKKCRFGTFLRQFSTITSLRFYVSCGSNAKMQKMLQIPGLFRLDA